jgi:hypothetical protein
MVLVFKFSFVEDILALFFIWQPFGLFFKQIWQFFFLSSGHSACQGQTL